MAYRSRSLNVVGYASGFTLWHYRAESADEVLAPGFFASASDMVCAGDMVLVGAPDGALQIYIAEVVPGPIVKGSIERKPGFVRVMPISGTTGGAAAPDSLPTRQIDSGTPAPRQ